jgi:hypothetical protein
LEDFRFGGLWISKVHHFVQEFINNDEVVSDGFFFKFFEVFGEDFDYFVQEEEDFGGIGIAFSEGEEVEVIMADV